MNDEQNPMDFNFTMEGIDTAFPSLAVGEYRVAFDEWKIKPTKKGGQLIRMTVSTQEPATDTKNKEQNPGFKTGFNLNLPSGGEHDEISLKIIAQFLDAVFGTDESLEGDKKRPAFNPSTLNAAIGKQFIIIVKKAKDEQYGETEIRGFKYIPQQVEAPTA